VAWAGRDQCTKDSGTERAKARCEDPMETVCCQQPGSPTVVQESSRQSCQLKSYREVPADQCVQVCCHSEANGNRWAPKASCPRSETQSVVAAHECDDVCCKMANKRDVVAKEGDCREKGGYGTALSECGTTVEVEKPSDLPDLPSELPPTAPRTDQPIDRPPASTPYM
jgi:hypothetical protein